VNKLEEGGNTMNIPAKNRLHDYDRVRPHGALGNRTPSEFARPVAGPAQLPALRVRFIGEQHVLEDLGRIPTVADWLGRI
jgi:hypothetical protein